MKRWPSTSITWAPSARATKYGVPPTDPNARTGEFTPPGMTSAARLNSDSLVSAIEALGQLSGEIREDDVGPGPLDSGEVLEGDGVAVDPAPLGGGLDHGVLAAHVVRGD